MRRKSLRLGRNRHGRKRDGARRQVQELSASECHRILHDDWTQFSLKTVRTNAVTACLA